MEEVMSEKLGETIVLNEIASKSFMLGLLKGGEIIEGPEQGREETWESNVLNSSLARNHTFEEFLAEKYSREREIMRAIAKRKS